MMCIVNFLILSLGSTDANAMFSKRFYKKKSIYVMELKVDGSAEEALRKISDRNYAGKYTDYSRRHGLALHTVGISFSSEGRCIEDWKEEMIVPGRE